jgi:hypothetical protein
MLWMSSGISATPVPGATTVSTTCSSRAWPGVAPSSKRRHSLFVSSPLTPTTTAQVVWSCGGVALSP